jgi:L-asparaginase
MLRRTCGGRAPLQWALRQYYWSHPSNISEAVRLFTTPLRGYAATSKSSSPTKGSSSTTTSTTTTEDMNDNDKNRSINSTEVKNVKVRNVWSEGTVKARPNNNSSTKNSLEHDKVRILMGKPLQQPAGPLWGSDLGSIEHHNDHGHNHDDSSFIPEVQLFEGDGRSRKRILVLCTGGTLTMAPDPNRGGALAPVEGAISKYMSEMNELHDNPNMPEFVLHEYSPYRDSSDLGPADWSTLAKDIQVNYLHFDGFVVLMGTDTMAYCATALSFMLENLGKPVIFTGSQIPLCEPYNDARRNLIMAMIFASRDTINEVSIFFHDRLLRANRATKVNTHRLLAFDSPNLSPLATIGIGIDENEHLVLPPPKGALRVHSLMDTRLLTIRLVPGFDDMMLRQMIQANEQTHTLKALVLQLYGTGNIPSVKESFIQVLADATDSGVLVIASTQVCYPLLL